jgi:hypothetical protein
MRDHSDPAAVLMREVDRRVTTGQAASHVQAWRQVLEMPRKPELAAAERNAKARHEAEVQLSEQVPMSPEQASPSKARPSIQLLDRVRRQPAEALALKPPSLERLPGESDQAYYLRLKAAMKAKGQPAGQAPSLDVSTSDPWLEAGEIRSESAYQAKQRALRNDPNANARELVRFRESRKPSQGKVRDTAGDKKAALAVMRGRGESIDPRSKGFSERYKTALKEVAR